MIELRELEPDDAESVQRIYGPESVRYLGRGPMELRDAQEFVADAVAAAKQSPRTLHTLGLVVDGDLLGVLKLHLDRSAAAISYILRPDSWGRGYATEGVHSILALAFGRLGLPEVHAKHHPDNPASGRVLLKAGFVPSGEHIDCLTYVVRPARTVGGSLFEPALPTPRDTPMSDSSGPGSFDPDGKRWRAEYTFLGQAAVPGPDGLPGLRGIPDNIGWSAADDFERLATQSRSASTVGLGRVVASRSRHAARFSGVTGSRAAAPAAVSAARSSGSNGGGAAARPPAVRPSAPFPMNAPSPPSGAPAAPDPPSLPAPAGRRGAGGGSRPVRRPPPARRPSAGYLPGGMS
ncbi:GNAT family N-acetyltransferase [Kitasatospora purpeofusca]|uniref:GNAT family N-acetyltransferase n=1 Tax=Kitasatospora purpeofusca TaxID=67352 RepID=UPI0036D30D6C